MKTPERLNASRADPKFYSARTKRTVNSGAREGMAEARIPLPHPPFGMSDGEVVAEFVEGEWRRPTDASDPAAVVTYSEEPSPETGHVGWMWWALGSMGDALTYEAACTAAVAEIQRRMDDRMAVL